METCDIGLTAVERDKILYLPPGWVSADAPDGVVVFAGSAAARIDGGGARRVVAALLPRLDGSCPASGLLEAAPQIAGPDLMAVLAALGEAGVLLETTDPDLVRRQAAARAARLEAARFTVAGPASAAGLCAAALRRQGARDVACMTREANAAGEADLSIVVAGAFELRCVADDAGFALGPLTVPGQAGCWRCAALRRQANAPFAQSAGAVAVDGGGDPALPARLAAELLAKEACDALCVDSAGHRLAGHLLAVDRASFAVSLSRVLPAPGCDVCGGPPVAAGETGAGPGSEFETLLAMSELADARVGLIHAVVIESAQGLGLERPIVATAVTACAPDGADPPTRMPVGWGKGLTANAAVLSAVGEALERYAASLPDPRRITWGRPGDLPPGEAVDPRDFPLFTPEQYARPGFPYVPFDPDIAHPWIAGWRAGTDERAWIPAAFCYLTFTYERRQNFCSGASNGLAAGVGVDDAALRAMLELVERDAFMASWRTRRGGARVEVDEDWDGDLLDVIGGIGRLGGEVRVALLPSACGIAVAACLALGDGIAWPGVTLGLGADPDPRSAIRQAVLELGQTGPYLRRIMREGAAVPARPQDVREMMDHAAYYFDPRRAVAFDHLWTGADRRAWASLPDGPTRSLEGCLAAMGAAGIRMWLADVTSADLAMTPFRVVRAVSPDLQPISFGFGLDRASVGRIAAEGVSLPAEFVSPIW